MISRNRTGHLLLTIEATPSKALRVGGLILKAQVGSHAKCLPKFAIEHTDGLDARRTRRARCMVYQYG